jgi:streptomycin 6-kinase
VPDSVRRRVRAEGGASKRWLDGLGDLVAGLERDWGIVVGDPLAGGTAAFVADATLADGTPAVVKLALPTEREGREALANEVRALLLADGRGCVRVLDADLARGAVLLEHLGRQLVGLGHPVPTQLRFICAALGDLWTVPSDPGLPSLTEKGRGLAVYIAATWEVLDRPCSSRVVDLAVSFAEGRAAAFDAEQAVVVHGDAHGWNTLEDPAAGRPDAFRLVDPDGLAGEAEYDLAIPMREYNDDLLAGDALERGRERARFLAGITGTDIRKIWEWGFVERVSTGLLATQEGLDGAEDFLVVAEQWSLGDPL